MRLPWTRPQHRGTAAPRRAERVVAVTGAAGRVGTACLAALADFDADVIAIDRRVGDGPADWRRADLSDERAAQEALGGATHLIHLAGSTRPDPDDPNRVLLDNVTIAANVFAAFAAGSPVTAVTASSTSAYGWAWSGRNWAPDYLPVDEDHPCLPDDMYGLSKLVVEQVGATWSRAAGFTSVMLRFPWTSGDEPDRIRSFITAVADDPDSMMARRQLWAYVHVADVADAFVRALDVHDGSAHVLNVCSPDVPGAHRLSELVGRAFPRAVQHVGLDREGAFSCAQARALLGWTPRRTFDPADGR